MLTEIASKSAILKSFEVRSSKCKHKLIMLISQKAMQNTHQHHTPLLPLLLMPIWCKNCHFQFLFCIS